MTIEQIAREISEDFAVGMSSGANRTHMIAEILRRHLPAGAGVVEVTGQQLCETMRAAGVPFVPIEWGVARTHEQGAYNKAAALLRARTVPAVGRVVPRPVRPVTQLVVPETGKYVVRYKSGDMDGVIFPLTEGDFVGWDAIRRIDTDAPTTWIERTTAHVAREWKAEDITITGWMMPYRNGEPVDWSGPYHSDVMDKAVEGANTCGADMLVALPTMGAA